MVIEIFSNKGCYCYIEFCLYVSMIKYASVNYATVTYQLFI